MILFSICILNSLNFNYLTISLQDLIFFFEFLAPLIEFTGIVGFLIFALFGMVNWPIFFILLGCILTFGFLYSLFAIFMEVLTYNQYKKKGDIFKLVLTAFLEPILFHPFVVWSAIRGNIDYLKKKLQICFILL